MAKDESILNIQLGIDRPLTATDVLNSQKEFNHRVDVCKLRNNIIGILDYLKG